MLPITSPTTIADMRTSGEASPWGRGHNIDDDCFDPLAVFLHHLDSDLFTRKAANGKHHPSVGAGTEACTSCGDPIQFELELWHHDEAMATVDAPLPSTMIVPSVLPADFSRLGDECEALAAADVDRIQFDVMDGRFVPNLTFGPDVIAAVRSRVDTPFEAHLMIEEPDHLLSRFVDAGCETIIVHAEACLHLHRTLASIRQLGASPAVALNPHTPIDILAHVLDLLDMVLVMTVNPGFGGQSYLRSMEPKVAATRLMLDTADHWIDLEVDGGISATTIGGAASAGANVFISGSALYRNPDGLAAGVQELRELAETAAAQEGRR